MCEDKKKKSNKEEENDSTKDGEDKNKYPPMPETEIKKNSLDIPDDDKE